MKIPDLQTGFRFLSSLPLANPQQAQVDLNGFLDALLQTPPAPDIYLQLLEQTRVSLCFVQEEAARRYADKALPLAESQGAVFQQVVATWLKASRAYSHCASLFDAGEEQDRARERLALILHRCLHYHGMALFEHHRARRQVASGLWLAVHGFYASAEEWEVAELLVPDSLDPFGRGSQCSAAFLTVLLTEVAGPSRLSARELTLVRRWASRWGQLVYIEPCAADEALPAIVVDLMRDAGLQAPSGSLRIENARRLDVSRLTETIARTRRSLQHKVPPEQLGLGEDCSGSECYRLLRRLARPWALVPTVRQYRRHQAAGPASVRCDINGMHHHILGHEFRQPDLPSDDRGPYSRQDFEKLYALLPVTERVESPGPGENSSPASATFAADEWQVLDQSANGFRLLRSTAGQRLGPGQLLSICPPQATVPILAQVVWLQEQPNGGLLAGVKAFPGRPLAVAMRPYTIFAAETQPYSRGFLLPGVSAIDSEPSLIIPYSWYRPDVLLEIHSFASGTTERVKLQRLVGHGPDFARVTFVRATPG